MHLNILKYVTLGLILLNIPSVLLQYYNPVISSLVSYLSFGLILLYYILINKTVLNKWMLLLGFLYFSIGSLTNQEYLFIEDKDIYFFVIKYFIMIIGGYELLKRISHKELLVFLMIGALTIFLEMTVLYNPKTDYGRYSGFFLNPNSMGFICMIGYALCYGVAQKKLRLIAQIVFTSVGFLTFSRTFIAVWLLTNLLSLFVNVRNIRILIVGFSLFIGLLTFNAFLPVKNERLEEVTRMMAGQRSQNTLQEDSRTETWNHFYGAIFERPFFGNGWGAFGGEGIVKGVGVHNAYLMVIGDAGLFVFIVFIAMYGSMLFKSVIHFKRDPSLLLMTIGFCLFIGTNHNYFDSGYLLFISMWIQYRLREQSLLADLSPEDRRALQRIPSNVSIS